jgi:hypothetical protein
MKNSISSEAKAIGAHVSGGNMKVGSIPNWSLTPGRTCSPEACKTCMREGCYAMKAYRMYPAVRKAWDENTALAESNLPALEQFFMRYFDAVTAPRFFRIHVAGDFVSREYAETWARIAAAHPGTRFLAFTKQWENVRGVDFPENFSLVLSGWPGTEIPADLTEKHACAFCVNSADEIPADGFHCPGACENCGACWELGKRGVNVYFVKH